LPVQTDSKTKQDKIDKGIKINHEKCTVVFSCFSDHWITLLLDRLQLWLLITWQIFVPSETSHPLSLKLRNFLLLSAFAIDWALCSLDSIDAISSRYYDGKRRFRQHVDY
jgi:hypothetical protein